MCDYSLHVVRTRPAKIEDKLVTSSFQNTITRGFAAVGEPNVAVCLLPGTEIASTMMSNANDWEAFCQTKTFGGGSHASGRST
jgi:hypothetical protein